jgi:hypothetical protein
MFLSGNVIFLPARIFTMNHNDTFWVRQIREVKFNIIATPKKNRNVFPGGYMMFNTSTPNTYFQVSNVAILFGDSIVACNPTADSAAGSCSAPCHVATSWWTPSFKLG